MNGRRHQSGAGRLGPAGNFVFVNIPTGGYLIEVTLPSFRALKRTCIVVSGGTRTFAAGRLDHRGLGLDINDLDRLWLGAAARGGT